MGSISLLGKQTPQLVCLFAKSSGGRRHTLERQGQLQQTRVKVREWKVKSQSKTQLKTQPEKMSNNPYGNLSAEVQSALANLNSDDSPYQPQNAHELFKLEQAVQIFFVTIDGQEHRQEYCQEHRGDGVGGKEGGDTGRS